MEGRAGRVWRVPLRLYKSLSLAEWSAVSASTTRGHASRADDDVLAILDVIFRAQFTRGGGFHALGGGDYVSGEVVQDKSAEGRALALQSLELRVGLSFATQRCETGLVAQYDLCCRLAAKSSNLADIINTYCGWDGPKRHKREREPKLNTAQFEFLRKLFKKKLCSVLRGGKQTKETPESFAFFSWYGKGGERHTLS